MLVAVLSEMIGAMVHAPHEPLPVTAGPELFDALGGRATVGMIVDGLYDRLERDRELSRLFRSPRQGERVRLKEFFEGLFGGRGAGHPRCLHAAPPHPSAD
jgi:truncated hemoglobin YjbI